MWFAPLSANSGGIDSSLKKLGGSRQDRVRKSLQTWLDEVNLIYHKPHNFRHGHAVYSIQRAKDIGDLKAISMNLMHENLQVTDGVYGIFSNINIHARITSLGNTNNEGSKKEMILLLEKMISDLKG